MSSATIFKRITHIAELSFPFEEIQIEYLGGLGYSFINIVIVLPLHGKHPVTPVL
jgi:hypothetical protein